MQIVEIEGGALLRVGIGGREKEYDDGIGLHVRVGGVYLGNGRIGYFERGVVGGVGQGRGEPRTHHFATVRHSVVFGAEQHHTAIVPTDGRGVFVRAGKPFGHSTLQCDTSVDDRVDVHIREDGNQLIHVAEVGDDNVHHG